MTIMMIASVWMAVESVDPFTTLSPVTQMGFLGILLLGSWFIIRTLWNQAMKAKDAEIAAVVKRAELAESARDRYESKLDHQIERTQTEVLSALKEATSTTRRALEITTRGDHENR